MAIEAASDSQTIDPMWQQYADALLTHTLGSRFQPDSQRFSVCSMMLYCDVADANQGIANAAVFSLADSIPAWTGSYAPWSSLATSYYLFLNYAILGVAPASPAISTADVDSLESAQVEPLQQVLGEISHRLAALAANPPVATEALNASGLATIETLRRFSKEFQQAGFGALHGRVRTLAAVQQNAPLERLVQAAANCQAVLGATGPSVLNMPVVYSSGTVSTYAPRYSLPELSQAYRQWQADAASGTTAVEIHLASPLRPSLLAARPIPHGLPSEAFLPWARSITANNAAASTAAGSNWQMDMKFAGLGAIPICPGGWLDTSLITEFAHRLPAQAPQFFGPTGSMALRPEYAILGYQPRVDIRSGTTTAYRALQQTLRQAVGPLKLGPLQIGLDLAPLPSADSANLSLAFDTGPSTVPSLLGVVSRQL